MSESVYTPEYQLFLEHLKAAREESGLSQRALASRLKKSYSYVAKVETGYSRMDICQIRSYLKAVGMSFRDFMSRYDEELIALEALDDGPIVSSSL